MTPEKKRDEALAEFDREMEHINQALEAHCKRYARSRRRWIVLQHLNVLVAGILTVFHAMLESWLMAAASLATMLVTAKWKILPKDPMDLIKEKG